MATIAEVNARVDCVEPKVGALNSAVFGVKDHPETGLMQRVSKTETLKDKVVAIDIKLNIILGVLSIVAALAIRLVWSIIVH
jgi:hypothetical protein